MRESMCEQMKVIKKIRKAKEMNGFAVELAEAQVADYVALKRDVDSVKESVKAMQLEQARQGESVNAMKLEQARQGGMIEAIFNRINSPVDQERKDGLVWHEIRAAVKSWKGWVLIIFFLVSVALAGDKLLQLLGWIPTGV